MVAETARARRAEFEASIAGRSLEGCAEFKLDDIPFPALPRVPLFRASLVGEGWFWLREALSDRATGFSALVGEVAAAAICMFRRIDLLGVALGVGLGTDSVVHRVWLRASCAVGLEVLWGWGCYGWSQMLFARFAGLSVCWLG